MVVVGFVIAALCALPFALGVDPVTGKRYFWEIMIPGSHRGAHRGIRDAEVRPPGAPAHLTSQAIASAGGNSSARTPSILLGGFERPEEERS